MASVKQIQNLFALQIVLTYLIHLKRKTARYRAVFL